MARKVSKSNTEIDAPKSSPPAEIQTPTVSNEPVVATQARPATPESTSANTTRASKVSRVETGSIQPIPESTTQDVRKDSVQAAKSPPEQSPESQDAMTTENEPSQVAPSAPPARSTPVQGSTESAVLIVPSVPSPVLDALPEKSLLIDIPPSTQEFQPAPASDKSALDKHEDSSKVDASNQEPRAANLPETDSTTQKENVAEPVPLVPSLEPALPLQENPPDKSLAQASPAQESPSDKSPSDKGLPEEDPLAKSPPAEALPEEDSLKENLPTKGSPKEAKDDTHALPSSVADSSPDDIPIEKKNDTPTGPLPSRAASIPGEFPSDETENDDNALPQSLTPEGESRQSQDVKKDVENITPHTESALVAASKAPSVDASTKDKEELPKDPMSETIPATVTPPVDSVPQRDTHDSVVSLPAPISEATTTPPNNEIPKDEAEHTESALPSHPTSEPASPPVQNTDAEIGDAPKVPPSTPPADAAVLPVESPLEQAKTTVENGSLDSAPEAPVLPSDKVPPQEVGNTTPEIQPTPATEPVMPPTKTMTRGNSKGSDVTATTSPVEVAASSIENPSEEKEASKRNSPSFAAQVIPSPIEQSPDKETAAGPEAEPTSVPEIAPFSPQQNSHEVVLPDSDSRPGSMPDSLLPAAKTSSVKSRENSVTPAPIPLSNESTPKVTEPLDPVQPHSQVIPRKSTLDSMPSIKEESSDDAKDVTDHKPFPLASESPAENSPNEINTSVRTSPPLNVPEPTAEGDDHTLADVGLSPVVQSAEDLIPQKQSEIQAGAVPGTPSADLQRSSVVEPTAIEPVADDQALPQAQTRQPSKFPSAAPSLLRAAAMTSTTSVPLPPAPQSSPKLPTTSDKAVEPLEAVANSPPNIGSIEEVIRSPTLADTPTTMLPKPDLTLPANASLPDQVSKRRRVVQVARELVARRRMLVLLLGHELGNATHAQLRHTTSTLAQVPVHG